jgi:hypothetical protein
MQATGQYIFNLDFEWSPMDDFSEERNFPHLLQLALHDALIYQK